MLIGASSSGQINPHLSTTMELRWAKRPNSPKPNRIHSTPPASPMSVPVYISTNPNHVNSRELRDLFASCNLSCHRFPGLGPDGRVVRHDEDDAETRRLSVALAHSSVVVSVFCSGRDLSNDEGGGARIGEFVSRMLAPKVDSSVGKLVGFGRAVSDMGLTASIYDVMVIPSLQGMGIGRMIVQRIVRILTGRDIYDIAALCSESQRPFFEACGFGDDILGSTTMMYTRTGSDGCGEVRRAGRNLLLIPTPKEFTASSGATKSWTQYDHSLKNNTD